MSYYIKIKQIIENRFFFGSFCVNKACIKKPTGLADVHYMPVGLQGMAQYHRTICLLLQEMKGHTQAHFFLLHQHRRGLFTVRQAVLTILVVTPTSQKRFQMISSTQLLHLIYLHHPIQSQKYIRHQVMVAGQTVCLMTL